MGIFTFTFKRPGAFSLLLCRTITSFDWLTILRSAPPSRVTRQSMGGCVYNWKSASTTTLDMQETTLVPDGHSRWDTDMVEESKCEM